MVEYADVCALVPTLDEAETIATVIDGLRAEGVDDVLVVDGGSTDGTRRLAREHGARVERQSGSGKGQAIRQALSIVDAEYVLMLDGDGTYRPEDAPAMLDPLLEGRADHVVGNRFADMKPGAMTRLNRVGNRLINRAFRIVHGRDFRDILSGYRAFSLESVDRFRLAADGFGIETELSVECAKHGATVEVVPISYLARPTDSETNLDPVRDGAVILATLYRLAKTNNPIFYFGSLGGLSALFGAAVGAYVGIEWVTRGVSHEVLALLAAFGLLFGVQLVVFGILSDMILALHREQLRRFR